MRIPYRKLALVALLATTLWGQSKNLSPSPQAALTPPVSPKLLIGSGDLLEVTVDGAPDYAGKAFRVNSDGQITLPLIGAVKIAGLSVEAAQKMVAQRLQDGKFFNDPQVSILIKEYATQGISVLGEVTKPGIYNLLGPHTLFDAISAAGGVTPKAGNKVMITHRGQTQAEVVELPQGVSDWSHSNVPVQPGDTVMMSKAGIAYVVGDVKKPGGFVMENNHLTVLQAIAMAEGINPTASLKDAKLIHKTASGQDEKLIALNNIYTGKAPDLNMAPDDILFIPNSKAKSGFRRTLDTIVTTASGMAIYHP